jgi:hypothetical protein
MVYIRSTVYIAEPYIYAVYDRIFGDFPAKLPYMYMYI